MARFQPPAPRAARARARSIRRRRCSRTRKRPLIMFGRGSRDARGLAAAHPARRAARRLRGDRPQARGAMFPTDHPAHYPAAVQRARTRTRASSSARPTSSCRSTGSISAARCGWPGPPASRRPRSSTRRSTRTCTPAPTWSTSRCRRSTSTMAADADAVVDDLHRRARAGTARSPGRRSARPSRTPTGDGTALTLEHRRQRAARRVQRSGERHLLHARPRLADRHLAVPERHGLSRQGRRRRSRLGARALGRLRARARRPAAATRSRCWATATSAWA